MVVENHDFLLPFDICNPSLILQQLSGVFPLALFSDVILRIPAASGTTKNLMA